MRSEWTVDTVKALLETRLDALERTSAAHFDSLERSHVDHLRWAENQVADIRRSIAELQTRSEARTDTLEARVDIAAGRDTGIAAGWAYLVGIIGVAASIVAVVLALAERT